MTGRCYFCASGEHSSCYSEICTCCGERNRLHQKEVDELEKLIKLRVAARGGKNVHLERTCIPLY